MTKDLLKELIPINLVSLMVVVGMQYYRSALRQTAVIADALADSVTGLPAFHPFWLLPTVAGLVYIVMTLFQFLHPGLFIPKTLVIFTLADLHTSLVYHDIGSLDSVLLGMAPALTAGALYLLVAVIRRRRRTQETPSAGGGDRGQR